MSFNNTGTLYIQIAVLGTPNIGVLRSILVTQAVSSCLELTPSHHLSNLLSLVEINIAVPAVSRRQIRLLMQPTTHLINLLRI